MKHFTRTTALLALSAIAFACGSDSSAGSDGPPKPVAEEALLPADSSIPTPDEAALEAATRISEENADAEFEKLKQELEDG